MIDKTTVTKTTGFEAYNVRAGHEWATILIRGWDANGNDGTPREIGEILIHSSYGSWAYQWGHLGMPFKKWLATCNDRSYVAEKFLGTDAREFDGKASVKNLRQSLLEYRRQGDITKNDARSIWDWIESNDGELEHGSEENFVRMLYECPSEADWQDADERPSFRILGTGPGRGARRFLGEPYDRPARSLNRQFASF